MPKEVSRISVTFSAARGAQKLGQPVPESNLVSELNRALSQQIQRKIPRSCRSQYFPENAISVSAWRVMSKALEESCLRHSASVLIISATWTVFRRWPESENKTIVTSRAAPAAATSTTRDFLQDHKARPPRVAAALAMNMRRVLVGFLVSRSELNIFSLLVFDLALLQDQKLLNAKIAKKCREGREENLLLCHVEIRELLAQMRYFGRVVEHDVGLIGMQGRIVLVIGFGCVERL